VTLIVLLLQLALLGLLPAADARASAADSGTAAGAQIEKPGTHHAVHDAADCAFCIALQLGAVPAALSRPPEAGVARRVAAVRYRPESHSPTLLASPVARAPPIRA
jgi:hypothetical protein